MCDVLPVSAACRVGSEPCTTGLTSYLAIAPHLSAPPPGSTSRCLGASVDIVSAARSLAAEASQHFLALAPALPVAAALLVLRERRSLLGVLEALAAAGCVITSLPAAAVAALLQLELNELGAASDLTALKGAPPEWTWLHWPSASDALTVVSRGRVLHVRRLRPEPRMAYVSGFLSLEECNHIIALGRNGGELHPSLVVNYEGGQGERSPHRSSESCRVSANKDRVVMRAVQRAAYLVGLTPAHAEAVQVVHYEPGGQYRPHHDYFSPEDKNYVRKCFVQGNRLVSFFVYLSPCAGGGRTYFPQLRVGFVPQPGEAVCWYNLDRHGNLDERTLHAGEPVTEGEKWGMNIWLRERAHSERAQTLADRGAIRATLQLSVRDGSGATQGGGCDDSGLPRSTYVTLTLWLQPPPSLGVQPCPSCGDATGPIGLCLCTRNYVV